MNELFTITIPFLNIDWTITPWKLIGYTGAILFTGRWIVQVIASKMAGRPVVPRLFWYLSISGSLMILSYFIFGKNDSVGILTNLGPVFIAGYNLFLDITHKKQSFRTPSAPASPSS